MWYTKDNRGVTQIVNKYVALFFNSIDGVKWKGVLVTEF